MICSFANIDKAKLDELQAMEKKMGKVLLAYICADANPAILSSEEVAQVHDLEKKLGLILYAVEG